MRKKIIVGNLKMNPVSPVEMDRYLESLAKELKGAKLERCEIIICPPVVYFDRCQKAKIKDIKLGGQDCFWEHQGAFTGEISGAMLKSNGALFSIAGHSERKKYFGENDEITNIKLKALFKNGLQPILCVGETQEERKRNQTANVIKSQLRKALADIGSGKLDFLNIVYEPIWAVGTDYWPSSDEILEAKLIIKKVLVEMYGARSAEKVRLLYGGSVNAKMTEQVCLDPAMDGVLVGRESLIPHEFVKIAKIIEAG